MKGVRHHMKNIDQTVRKETGYISFSVLILSLLMEAVFLIIEKWNYTVLLGNVLSTAAAILNFFLMGLTIQNATKKEEKEARNKMKLSQSLRMMMLFVTAAIGCLVPCFHIAAVLIPLFFPRIAIAFRAMFLKKDTINEV